MNVWLSLLPSCHIDELKARAVSSGKNQYTVSARAKKRMNNAKRPIELQKIKPPSEDQEAYMLPALKMFIEK